MADHILAYAWFPNIYTELQQFAVDPWRTPQRILPTHLADHFVGFGSDRRSSKLAAPNLPSPEQLETLPMPGNHSFRFHDHQRRIASRSKPCTAKPRRTGPRRPASTAASWPSAGGRGSDGEGPDSPVEGRLAISALTKERQPAAPGLRTLNGRFVEGRATPIISNTSGFTSVARDYDAAASWFLKSYWVSGGVRLCAVRSGEPLPYRVPTST
jgi:hypothetical protein